MRDIVSWTLFAVPLAADVVAWVALYRHWPTESHRTFKVLGMLLATAAPSYACVVYAYVRFVAPEPAFDYTFEHWGLLVALAGILAGFVKGRPSAWYSWLPIGSSAWIFALFFMASMTY
jgi:hypothetical protein